MRVLGEVDPVCTVKQKQSRITFKVVEERVIPLLGRKTCIAQNLITRIDSLEIDDVEVYDGLGCLKGYIYDIDLVENAQWESRPARHVPHSIRDQVKKELDAMEKLGVIERIHEPTPVVNQNLLRRHHPLTTMEEISARLKNSKCFSILDCKKGFWQIRVTERTSKYLTFGTPWGRYCCKRLPFGLASAPEVFQKVMQDILEGIDGVECSMDDVLIHAENESHLESITKEVISRIIVSGLKLNKEKCIFNKPKVKFLGHLVTSGGLMADPDKLTAVLNLKTPSNKLQLQRALGMITYLAKFVPNLSAITAPLRALLSKDTAWSWESEQEIAFQKIKKLMISPPVLAFYDVNLPIVLSVDASSNALGAMLMQEGRPVAYASKALSKAEMNYPQIEKEAAAIRFACRRFHQYIYGKALKVETDHKPLESIFRKPLDRAPPRLRRIRLEVAQYNPQVVYVKGKNIPIPDILSRDVAHSIEPEAEEEQLEVHLVLQMSKDSCKELRYHTESDSETRLLKEVILRGWPDLKEDVSLELKKYWCFRDELAVYDGLVFKSNQVVVPLGLRKKMLNAIHSGHSGIQSCIRRAKQVVFWVNMNTDIQNLVEGCSICQRHQRCNTKSTIASKDVPELPFERVASDLFHFRGADYVVIVDSYSNFFDFKKLSDPTSEAVILEMKTWFSVHGIPKIVESDNGPQYSSEKFRKFANDWGFEHLTSSPHFPRANGLAERYVQVTRNTPRSESIPSPNERLMGRLVRSNLPITKEALRPKVFDNVREAIISERDQQKQYADRSARIPPQFGTGEKVQLQDPKSKLWSNGEVLQRLEDGRSYIVSDGGKTLRRNTHHLRRSNVHEPSTHHKSPESNSEGSEILAESQVEERLPASEPTQDCRSPRPQGSSTRSGRMVKSNQQSDFEYY
ncbi:uncharacterized protein K02A2.6-like [Uranotaenia lowii]|uniref:uncharacterized protein K02A2.6-like n=1 Tax=Uranotaenia lowii TaxID=190385 RepID=UPI002478DA47|nr:uncharacterized protein K02A2.6-like [Uranotaenia lowii]